jgi:hypothetical protein
LRLGKLVGQHLDLATQPRRLGLQQLHLIEELDEALAFELRFQRGDAIVELLLDLRETLIRRLDALARLFVIEQCRVRRHADEQQRRQCCPCQSTDRETAQHVLPRACARFLREHAAYVGAARRKAYHSPA